MSDYNGYTNYATWNVCLWVDNEYGLYQEKVTFLNRVVRTEETADDIEITANQAENLYTNLLGGNTPDLEENKPGLRWQDVNWDEVANELTIEAKELYQYS